MQAIILAAGMGKRLKELTKDNTKCMVQVNGVTLIERMLRQIERQHLSRIVIVVGFEGKKLVDYIATLEIQTPIVYVENPIYDKTNNIYSLSLAGGYLCAEDTLLFESDLIFEDAVIELLLKDPRDTLALVDKYESWMDGTCVKLGEDDSIEAFVPGQKFKFEEIKDYYKTVNIYKFSKHFSQTYYVPFLEAYQKALGLNEYYEQVLRVITTLDRLEIKAKKLTGQLWYEIDDIQDLDIAESMFAPSQQEKFLLLQERCGGYWRYPDLLDFCHPANPYFPPQKLMDEMKASFEKLLTQQPSGVHVTALLAAKKYGVSQKNILAGSEVRMSKLYGGDGQKVGIVDADKRHSLWCQGENDVVFQPQNPHYTYSALDLMDYFQDQEIGYLLVENPDSFSGNYMPKADIQKLVAWTKEREITLVIDESLADFAEEENNTLILQEILENNPHLYVIKSISESCGVPGLKLAVLASGNVEFLDALKKSEGMGKIDSYAEFYLQIEEKYKKHYADSLLQIYRERNRLESELKIIEGIQVISSQANCILAELTGRQNAGKLCTILLQKYNLLVKDVSQKDSGKQYLLFSIRKEEDNDKLVGALRRELR